MLRETKENVQGINSDGKETGTQINTVEVEVAAGETPSLTGEVVGEIHRGLERAQAHPLGNQHQRGPV